MRTCKWLLAAGTLTTLASVVAADIFKCTDEGGRVTFNDRGCASTERSQKPVIVVSVVSRAELTPGEQQTLADVIHRQRLQRSKPIFRKTVRARWRGSKRSASPGGAAIR
jgi:hypothetical protein